jgi:hypothetical protein
MFIFSQEPFSSDSECVLVEKKLFSFSYLVEVTKLLASSIQVVLLSFLFVVNNSKIMLILKGEAFGNREKSRWNFWIILRFSTLSLLIYCFLFI